MRTSTLRAFAGAFLAALFLAPDAALAQGTITGRINFDGRMERPKRVRVSGDVFCIRADREDPILKKDYVFNYDEGTLCDVVVYVSSPVEGTFEPPVEPAEIDQDGCQYVPHVSGVMAGQTLRILNSDSTSHNLNLQTEENRPFNVSQPQKGMVHEVKFADPELAMYLKCDVHSWMGAHIAVFDHPFFAVSDDKGTYEIENLPPGEYEITVWHHFRYFAPKVETQTVTVTDGETTQLDFTYGGK